LLLLSVHFAVLNDFSRDFFYVQSFAIKDKGFSDLEAWLRFKDRMRAKR
jgi:hypothetical protein